MKKHKGRQLNRSQKQAKRKATLAARKETTKHRSLLNQVRTISSTFGINYCAVTEDLFDVGIGNVVLGRTLSSGRVATAFFLVDVYCLGVKDAFYSDRTHSDLRQLKDRCSAEGNPIVDISPECALKIIDGAVAYGRKFGFSPPADYPPAYALFGDTDVSACPTEYEFGKEGKPLFISGPNDTPAKITKIVRSLTKTVGVGNFDYIMAAGHLDEPDFGSDY